MSLTAAPCSRPFGITPSRLGNSTWCSTTPRIVLRSRPSATLARKASSRLGPTMPLVLARASVWQEPHLATKSCLPSIRLALSAPFTPQPVVNRASASSSPQAPARTRGLRGRGPAGTPAAWKRSTSLMSGRNTIREAGCLGAPPRAPAPALRAFPNGPIPHSPRRSPRAPRHPRTSARAPPRPTRRGCSTAAPDRP